MQLRREGLSTRELDGRLIILDLHRSRYLSVSRTGTVLLHLIEEGLGADELAGALVERYAVERDVAVRDVEAFITQLSDAGLLEQQRT
jgi:hypothetical protein